ncbi:hypothetical protein N7470_006074 [Penicillium chermesinum]|nr:hypothetical protein N7470_006074 [Penicillium chermesinum]
MHATVYTGLLCALAAPALGAVWESLPAGVPATWSHVNTPSGDSSIGLSIALSRKNLDQLETVLREVSTPGHPKYGQWLDKDDVDSQFPVVDDAPVVSWLKEAGITSFARDGALLNFTGSVEKVNKLLDTQFAYYQNGDSVKLRTTQYSIPDDLADHIDLISPTVYFGKSRGAVPKVAKTKQIRRASNTGVSPACASAITPQCVKEMYNVGNYTPKSDLKEFAALFNIPEQSFTVETLFGGVDNQNAPESDLTEADLDVQLILGVSHPLPIHEFVVGGVAPFIPDADEPTQADDENEPYLPYYSYLLSKTNAEIPQVISNSYGDDEQTVPIKYAKLVCNLIGLNTASDQPVSLAMARPPQFNPIFPATCPYVTAVGGTSAVSPEVAWNASSGGFSSIFPRAWFQEGAIPAYLAGISTETKEYYGKYTDFGGRGFPDVSAHSLYPAYEVIYVGKKAGSGGTSAAAPTVAGIIGLLNDARLRAGKPVLGYLNPFLYSLGYKALNDIVEGGSYGCGGIDPQSDQEVPGALVIPGAHWNATVGWDPVTGLGTPNFQKLKELVLSL